MPYLRGSIIVKFRPGTGGRRRARHDRRVVRIDHACAVVRRFRHRRDRCRRRIPKRRRRRLEAAAGRRVRAGALPRALDVRAERSALFAAVELPGHRHGARVGHQPGRHLVDHRGGARQRRGVPDRPCCATTRARVACSNGPTFISRRLASSTCRSRPRRISARREPLRLAPRFHLGRRRCRSTSTATARTSPAPSARLTNNSVGVAGHGVQRPDHAGEGHRPATGTSSSTVRSRAPTTWWRAGFATRWTTARRCST